MTTFNQTFKASKNTVFIDFDFDEVSVGESNTDKEEIVFEYDFDPLCYVLYRIDKKDHLTQAFEFLDFTFLDADEIERRKKSIEQIDLDQYQEKSKSIRTYFKHRLFMRRLNSKHISKYMLGLEEILENPTSIKRSNLKILVKLPDFYRESTETDAVLKNAVSVNKNFKQRRVLLSEQFEFVNSIKRNSKNQNVTRFYFKNKTNNLLLIEATTGSNEYNLIDYLVRQDKPILIDGSCLVRHQAGYDEFLMYQDGDLRYYDPDSKTTS